MLISNFYVLLGIIILFIVAFNILKSIINPDEQKKGTETIKKMLDDGLKQYSEQSFFRASDFQEEILDDRREKYFQYICESIIEKNE